MALNMAVEVRSLTSRTLGKRWISCSELGMVELLPISDDHSGLLVFITNLAMGRHLLLGAQLAGGQENLRDRERRSGSPRRWSPRSTWICSPFVGSVRPSVKLGRAADQRG